MEWTTSAKNFLTSRSFPKVAGGVVGAVAGGVLGGGVGAVPGAAAGAALGEALDTAIRGPEVSAPQAAPGAVQEASLRLAVLQSGEYLGFEGEAFVLRSLPATTVAVVRRGERLVALLDGGAEKELPWRQV